MLNRAFKLASTWKLFHLECECRLRYPRELVESTICRFIDVKVSEASHAQAAEECAASIRIILPFKDQKSANSVRRQLADLSRKINTEISPVVLSSCTGSQEPIKKTQQCSTAKQRFIKKGVQWLFPLCTGTPGHNQPGVYKSKDKE